jgi:Bacterial SH3 domain.
MSKKSKKKHTKVNTPKPETQPTQAQPTDISSGTPVNVTKATETKDKEITIKLNRKVIIIVAAALAIIISAVVVFFCFFSPFDKAEPTDAPISGDASAEVYDLAKNAGSFLGFWHIGDEKNKELTINNITDETVVFSLWYQEIAEINEITAAVDQNTASFVHKTHQGSISGTLTFNDKEITVNITNSEIPNISAEIMSFRNRHFQSWGKSGGQGGQEGQYGGYKSGYIKTDVTSNINVRSEPNTSSNVVASLSAGKGFNIINYSGEWCFVRLYTSGNEEKKGYIFAEYVTETKPEPRITTKTTVVDGVTFVYPISYSDEFKDVKFSLFEITRTSEYTGILNFKLEGTITSLSEQYVYLNYVPYDNDGFALQGEGLFSVSDKNFKVSRTESLKYYNGASKIEIKLS